MNTERIIWTILFLVGGAFLLYRAAFTERGMGKAYVNEVRKEFMNVAAPGEEPQWVNTASEEAVEIDPTTAAPQDRISWSRYEAATPRNLADAVAANPNQTAVQFSLSRTIGIWVAAFFTLALFSFLYRDNPLYKVAESILIGQSAAYWMVVAFWDVLIPNLVGRIVPDMTKAVFLPGLSGKDLVQIMYVAPLILGVMLLWRLAPKGTWIARWPLAFIIGTTAGIRLTGFIHADFLTQIRAGIIPLAVMQPGSGLDIWDTVQNLLLVGGVLVCLVYFFFSFEHKGIVGHTARVGIWVLMITFGAGFAYTVMGRITLLAMRFEFLFDDWLWLIDPLTRRAAAGG